MDTEEKRPDTVDDGTQAEVNALRNLLSQLGDPDAAHEAGVIDDDLHIEQKAKKMARMVADGVMTPEQVEQSYQSWRGGMAHLDAHRSVLAMDALYRSLFENLAGGVAQCSQTRKAIRAERPRHSGRAAAQNGGLDRSETK